MGALSSAAYALVIVLLTTRKPQQIEPSVEWTQWATLTATLAVMAIERAGQRVTFGHVFDRAQ